MPPEIVVGVLVSCGKCHLTRDIELDTVERFGPVLTTTEGVHIQTVEPCQCGSHRVVARVNLDATG